MNDIVNELSAVRAVMLAELRYIEKNNRRPTHCVLPQKVYDRLVELKARMNERLNPSGSMPKNANNIETMNGLIAIASPHIQTVVVFEEIVDGVLIEGGTE